MKVVSWPEFGPFWSLISPRLFPCGETPKNVDPWTRSSVCIHPGTVSWLPPTLPCTWPWLFSICPHGPETGLLSAVSLASPYLYYLFFRTRSRQQGCSGACRVMPHNRNPTAKCFLGMWHKDVAGCEACKQQPTPWAYFLSVFHFNSICRARRAAVGMLLAVCQLDVKQQNTT